MRHKRILVLLAALCLLGGCGGEERRVSSAGPEPVTTPDPPQHVSNSLQNTPTGPASDKNETPGTTPTGAYKAPEFLDAQFHPADEESGVQLDLSSLSEGYVAVAAKSEARLKFQVIMGEMKYTYDIASDGTPSIFPLQCGDGTYKFRVMENVVDTKYAEKYKAEAEVKLKDEFQPFLRPSNYVNYGKDSHCVKKAQELAAKCDTATDVVAAVYEYICGNIKYDYVKVKDLPTGYLPDVDETLSTGKGICFDYASLAAAMLRSQGIPTRVIFGNVSPDDLYHAWNMFYTEETGWITVDYQVTAGGWNRLDLTFSANGADGKFIGDGGNYAEVYVY